MREVLLSYREQAGVHGIVFIRTRADARVLHSILSSGGAGLAAQRTE
jgi:hypothetical protein